MPRHLSHIDASAASGAEPLIIYHFTACPFISAFPADVLSVNGHWTIYALDNILIGLIAPLACLCTAVTAISVASKELVAVSAAALIICAELRQRVSAFAAIPR